MKTYLRKMNHLRRGVPTVDEFGTEGKGRTTLSDFLFYTIKYSVTPRWSKANLNPGINMSWKYS